MKDSAVRRHPGGRNVHAITRQALTDLGRGPACHGCLAELRAVPADVSS